MTAWQPESTSLEGVVYNPSRRTVTHPGVQGLELIQHSHPREPARIGENLGKPPTAIARLVLPRSGWWYIYVTCAVLDPSTGRRNAVVGRHALHISGAEDSVPLPSPLQESGGARTYETVLVPSTDHLQPSAASGSTVQLPATRAEPGAMTARVVEGADSVWVHECARLVVSFADASSGQDAAGLHATPRPSMHALLAAWPVQTVEHGDIALSEAWAWPAGEGGGVPCGTPKFDALSEQAADNSSSQLVLYARFHEAGPHVVFLQVRFSATRPLAALVTLRLIHC